MFKAEKILVAIDFSPESDLALKWAIRIAQGETKPFIVLCHVLTPLAPVGPETFAPIDYVGLARRAVGRKLRTLQAQIPPSISSSYIIKVGPIAQEIAEVCEDEAFDLAIVTTHGRRGLSHLIQGSTSEQTVRLAPCPVLVLHLNKQSLEMKQASKADV